MTLTDGIIIDAGHGGTDPGAVSSFKEKDMTLKISLYQYARYKELGVPVKITRPTDMSLEPEARTKLVRDSGMKLCTSNHINAGGGDGAEVIHSIHSNGRLANLILDKLVEAGQNKRKAYCRAGDKDPKKDYYFMHRDTGAVETVIVEYGFLDSKKDDVKQLTQNWQTYAEATVAAVTRYLGHTYKPPENKK